MISILRGLPGSWYAQAYLQGLCLSGLSYMLYLEMSPKMGGILIRPGPDGRKHFSLEGLRPMLWYPFQSLTFWYPSFWDLNFIIFTQTGTILYIVAKAWLQSGAQ